MTMAYEPYKEWDPGAIYYFGQTCVYNGLPYLWYSYNDHSTAGRKPYDDLVDFIATDGVGSISRKERGWILCDNGDYSNPSYGSSAVTQPLVRGTGHSIPNLVFEKPQSIKFIGNSALFTWVDEEGNSSFDIFGNRSQKSWAYYGWSMGMSIDYGLENVTPHGTVPATNGKIHVGTYASTYPDVGGAWLPSTKDVDDTEGVARIRSTWPVYKNVSFDNGGADTAGNSLWFGRTVGYTMKVIFYDIYYNIQIVEARSNSITHPALADKFSEPFDGPIETFNRPPFNFGWVSYIFVDSINPPLDI